MADENKVQFNLKNVHVAVLGAEGTYGTPIAVPGAVSIALDPQGEVTPFYADGIVYYHSNRNNGYSGDLEVAKYPEKVLIDIWGFELNEDKVLVENADIEPKSFALLYQIDGDKTDSLYCLYNCTGTRPGIGSVTNTETKEPHTQKSTIAAVPLANGKVMARTTSETSDAVKKAWFSTVYNKEGSAS